LLILDFHGVGENPSFFDRADRIGWALEGLDMIGMWEYNWVVIYYITKLLKMNGGIIMKIPTTLKHKPVIVSENYADIDGRQAYNSDAKGLSLGLAQWNDRGKVDISAKVWRHTGEKWSRQSEELPLHRVLDLAILVSRAMLHFREAYRFEKLYDPENPVIDRVGLQGDAMTVAVCTDNAKIDEDLELFRQALSDDDELLGERLRTLSRMLKEMGY
jgi:hypothetical protein